MDQSFGAPMAHSPPSYPAHHSSSIDHGSSHQPYSMDNVPHSMDFPGPQSQKRKQVLPCSKVHVMPDKMTKRASYKSSKYYTSNPPLICIMKVYQSKKSKQKHYH